jgi:cytochrome b
MAASAAVVGLLVFRLVWGFAGSTYARFSQFIRGPGAIRDYLQGRWQGEGHNPLGALSVLALLATLILLVATGLFANDDIAFEGPLYALVGKELSDRVVGIHRLIEPLIMLLVFAHLAAIVFYTRVKKQDLVKPMVTGWKARCRRTGQGWRCNRFLHRAGDRPAGRLWSQRRLAAAGSVNTTGRFRREHPGVLAVLRYFKCKEATRWVASLLSSE